MAKDKKQIILEAMKKAKSKMSDEENEKHEEGESKARESKEHKKGGYEYGIKDEEDEKEDSKKK